MQTFDCIISVAVASIPVHVNHCWMPLHNNKLSKVGVANYN